MTGVATIQGSDTKGDNQNNLTGYLGLAKIFLKNLFGVKVPTPTVDHTAKLEMEGPAPTGDELRSRYGITRERPDGINVSYSVPSQTQCITGPTQESLTKAMFEEDGTPKMPLYNRNITYYNKYENGYEFMYKIGTLDGAWGDFNAFLTEQLGLNQSVASHFLDSLNFTFLFPPNLPMYYSDAVAGNSLSGQNLGGWLFERVTFTPGFEFGENTVPMYFIDCHMEDVNLTQTRLFESVFLNSDLVGAVTPPGGFGNDYHKDYYNGGRYFEEYYAYYRSVRIKGSAFTEGEKQWQEKQAKEAGYDHWLPGRPDVHCQTSQCPEVPILPCPGNPDSKSPAKEYFLRLSAGGVGGAAVGLFTGTALLTMAAYLLARRRYKSGNQDNVDLERGLQEAVLNEGEAAPLLSDPQVRGLDQQRVESVYDKMLSDSRFFQNSPSSDFGSKKQVPPVRLRDGYTPFHISWVETVNRNAEEGWLR